MKKEKGYNGRRNYSNNKKNYNKPKKNLQKIVFEDEGVDEKRKSVKYQDLVNAPSNDEIRDYEEAIDNDSVIKVVAVGIVILAIVFGSLLLFHLI